MSKPRTHTSRELFGVLGPHSNSSALQRDWNKFFADEGIDAFMDSYPATQENLHERLSEMYHFDRRGYIVSISLSEAIYPLLDILDISAVEQGSVNLIRNNTGVLNGYYYDTANTSPEDLYQFFRTGEW